jgi:hypothetical protein
MTGSGYVQLVAPVLASVGADVQSAIARTVGFVKLAVRKMCARICPSSQSLA